MTAARALLGALAMVLAACGTVDSRDAADTRPGPAVTGATAAGAALPTTEQPCGRVPSPPAQYTKVLWVMFENQSYEDLIGVVGSAQEQRAPYLNWLSRRCGLATASYGITHPSLPNYLGLVSGTTGGIVATCTPAACPQTAPTLFAQVRASGRQWKVYAESMTSNCQKTDTSLYAARHTGAPYYPAIAADCARNQVPMGTTTSGALVSDLAAGALPAFSMVVPNMCNIQHDCPINTGDRWLRSLMPKILAGPDYLSGNTLVLLSYDEGFRGTRGIDCAATLPRSCHIVTIAIAHAVPRGLRTGVRFNHYAMLRATEDVLGLGRLGGAASSSVPSLRTAFRF